VKAPLLLRRHPPLLFAVVVATCLAALAAGAPPLVREGAESESLQGQLRTMTPLGAGFEITTFGTTVSDDPGRRAAAARLGRSLSALGPLVASSLLPAKVAGTAAPGLDVVALARTGAVEHVGHVTRMPGAGAWIADSTATVTHLRPGDELRLTEQRFGGRAKTVGVRVAGVYRTLEGDRDNPYWANWQQDIRSPDPDSPPPPAFVLMSRPTFDRVAATLSRRIENRYEYPVDPRHMTFSRARGLARQLSVLSRRLTHEDFGLDCRPANCRTNSAVGTALTIASNNVTAVAPTIALLSGIGIAIALGLAVATGVFLVRRRSDEAHALFTRGEAPLTFGARVAIEAALPALIGSALGIGGALLALSALAPAGTIAGAPFSGAVWRGAAAATAAASALAAGAAVAFSGRGDPTWWQAGRRAGLPWEALPVGVAAALLAVVVSGHGLARDVNGTTHPRLAVFLVPVIGVAGVAGLATRLVRRLLRGRGSGARLTPFLALRRIVAAGGLLVVVVVAAATAFGTYAYAATLSTTLDRSTAEKAYVSNGSNVQGFVDPGSTITSPFPFPATIVEIDPVALDSGASADLVAGDPRRLARTLLWHDGWDDDPRRLLPRLASPGNGLAAIATPGAPHTSAIFEQGVRIPIRIVGHAPVPGSTAGRPALLVSRPALRRITRSTHIIDPPPQATGLLWAKGPPSRLLPVLERSSLAPAYLTALDHIGAQAAVRAAERSYRYVEIIGVAAAAVALVALLLYLQARHRSQLIASAITRRMGLRTRADAAAAALEAAGLMLFAAVVGGAAATLAARPIARHLDSLPQYAPAPVYTVPWTALLAGGAAAVVTAAILGAASVAIARRADVGSALRVA
jgi:putative ABC transport system permease protein